MEVEYDKNVFSITVFDAEVESWKDGHKLFYQLNKDERPNININHFDHYDEAIGEIHAMATMFGINKCPEEIQDGYENLKNLHEAYNAYKNHILYLCLNRLTTHNTKQLK